MTLDAKITLLQQSSLFTEFTRSELEEIVTGTEVVLLSPKTIFITQGANADGAYVIDSGSIKIYTLTDEGKEIPINILSHGDIVGEMALIDGQTRSANAETITEVRMLKIPTQNFQTSLLHNPKLALKLLSTLSGKIRELDANITAVYSQNAAAHTLEVLKTLSQAYQTNEIPLTHEELAKLVGITRPRLTEALHSLSSEGKILQESKKIVVL